MDDSDKALKRLERDGVKMAKIKKITSVVLMLIILISSATALVVSADALTNQGFEYVLTESEYGDEISVKITKYNGSSSKVVIPYSIDGYRVKTIGGNAFKGNKTLKNIIIKAGIEEINEGAFCNCSKLSGVSLGTVRFIGYNAFKNCRNLKSIKIPKTLIGVTGEAFTGCKNLKRFKVEKGNSYFCAKNGVLVKKGALSITAYPEAKGTMYSVPEEITSIDEGAFKGNSTIKKVVMNKGVKYINEKAFENCKNLRSVKLSVSLDTIRESAFKNCRKIKNIKLPKKLKTIEDEAFLGCSKIKKIRIPEYVENIGEKALGYTRQKGRYQKKQNFKIIGSSGSVAERYATENGFKFISK